MFSKKGYILLFYITVRMQGHLCIYKLENQEVYMVVGIIEDDALLRKIKDGKSRD